VSPGGPEAARLATHLEACPACRATATALVSLRGAGARPARDLWPRLAERLRASEEQEWVRLAFPPFTWREAMALGAAVLTLVVIPDAARFLAAFGML
jgi:hypothetical protein